MRRHIGLILSRTFRLSQYRPASTMSSRAVEASRAVLTSINLENYDPEQSRLMDERCILVDEQDRALGAADKKTCASCSLYPPELKY